MLSFAMLDRIRDPADHALDLGPAGWSRREIGSVARNAPAIDAEAILHRLVHRRSGRHEDDVAFRQNELERVCRLLTAAGEARGHVVPTRRRKTVAESERAFALAIGRMAGEDPWLRRQARAPDLQPRPLRRVVVPGLRTALRAAAAQIKAKPDTGGVERHA